MWRWVQGCKYAVAHFSMTLLVVCLGKYRCRAGSIKKVFGRVTHDKLLFNMLCNNFSYNINHN
ncbi:hypothetical protein ETA_32200 [Erwinia tasmaniensis Et1/99]|uniref:Uncharacterized protein n=1 Tax=Erwinia tasmaniensis (strain DSM 17950 / CFBP 7177 / CIP 109463 / NCPPB 4357 / Et1/99) TaxID=465817 RepID=B2VJV2_ERWT9|nr:hypothetical protein ETA_32200 [Erwinia tasmaniensis Et1/99]